MLPTLHTARLVLRPLAKRDAPLMEHYAADAGVAFMLTRVPHPYPPGEAADFIDEVLSMPAKAAHLHPFVIDRGGDFAGVVAIAGVGTPHADDVTLGYWLGRPHWGKGYASEAVRSVLGAYVFGTLKVARVFAGAFADNPASLGILRKLGFREIGISQKHSLARGCDAPHVDFELTRAQFLGGGP